MPFTHRPAAGRLSRNPNVTFRGAGSRSAAARKDQGADSSQPTRGGTMTTTPQLIAGDPGLLAGWEPHAPVGDSLVRRFLHAFGEAGAVAAGAMGGTVLRTGDMILTDAGRPAGFSNRVMLLRPLGVVPVAETLAVIDEATAGGTGEVVIFSAWPTPDLRGSGWKL